MSWDVFVQDIPAHVKRVSEMPEDYQPQPLGKRGEIITRIKEIVPSADFSDPSRGHLDGPRFSIEVSMGKDEEVGHFAFHVYGGDLAPYVVARTPPLRIAVRARHANYRMTVWCI